MKGLCEKIIENPEALVSGIVQAFNREYNRNNSELQSSKPLSEFDMVEIAVCSKIRETSLDAVAAAGGYAYITYDYIRNTVSAIKKKNYG